jgi:ferrochelatase
VTDLGWDAVLLAGFGGPEGPDDVLPFLRNVTRGRGIPEERLVEVSHHYQALGGVSPINEQNRALRQRLSDELRDRGIDLPVLWGNRNWRPYLADVVRDAYDRGMPRLLALATSAYSSYSSCRQYREDFAAALLTTGLVGKARIDKLRLFWNSPGFLLPFADGLRSALQEAADAGIPVAETEVVFTTHSIPITMALGSGPSGTPAPGAYVRQHLAACEAVIKAVGVAGLQWQLAYQSRSGPPSMPWLEPDVNDVLEESAQRGRRGVVVVPIGFVSDHVEVVWDLDHEAKATAEDLGLFFARVATPGVDSRFVSAMADLVQERLDPAFPRTNLTEAGPAPDRCGPSCCENLRGRRPTTAAVDSSLDWAETGIAEELLCASGIAPASVS